MERKLNNIVKVHLTQTDDRTKRRRYKKRERKRRGYFKLYAAGASRFVTIHSSSIPPSFHERKIIEKKYKKK